MGAHQEGQAKNRTRWWLALVLVAVSVVTTAVAVEVALRLLPADLRGYAVSERCLVHPREFVRDRTRNSLGFHDVEHASPKRCSRVFLLGDSYVEASSVALSQTVGRQLEAYLNERSTRRHEVIAIGHSGWGQERELRALRELAPTYGPDIVVTLFLSLNDVLDDSQELRRRQREVTRRLLRHRPDWLSLPFDDAPALLLERSELNRFLSFRLAILISRLREMTYGALGIPVAYFVYAQQYDDAWTEAWIHKDELIAATKRCVSENGALYLMVSASTPQGVLGEQGLAKLEHVYPAMSALSWDLDRPDRLLSAICERQGIPILLLEPLFRQATESGRELHWRFDGHWNVEGNRMAAERIGAFVLAHEDRSS